MENYFRDACCRLTKLLLGLAFVCSALASCNDTLFEEVNEPSWLGASIYDYLQQDGNFKNYVRLIDDLGYKEVFQLTGSKTLFVANDSAFERFFVKNGIAGYNQLTTAQKKLIFNFGMVNDAYLMETFSNYYNSSLNEGGALRRASATSSLDSVPYEVGTQLPLGHYWDRFRSKGVYLLKDNTNTPLVFFTQKNMEQAEITDGDFKLFTGLNRSYNDVHIFNHKVIKRDITCKNGYVNVLGEVMMAPDNMAQYIRSNARTQTFSTLMDRFSAPYYDATSTILSKQLNPSFSDSIFVKKYFSNSGGRLYYPDGKLINTQNLLPFDPGWNSYCSTVSNTQTPLESDMATMFVPTDDAIKEYFENGSGKVLRDRYGSWENVPNDILALLIKRHMRNSFIQSVPSRFSKMIDDENSSLPVNNEDIVDNYIGVNGAVYVTNKVYPPEDYVSVYAPVLFSDKSRVFKWGVLQNDFRLYLNSLISRYSFFVPTDEYFKNYIDPVVYGKDIPAALKFWYNDKTSMVNATIYRYDKSSKVVGDSVGVIAPTMTSDNAYNFIVNRLLDLLESHIVIGSVESGQGYYFTKGNNVLKVSGSGSNLTVQGGEDILNGQRSNVLSTYSQSNGKTYFIDKPLQSPLKSVYKVMSETPEFSEFFKLLTGFPASDTSVVFVKKTNYYGIDFVVRFFNTFNYTVYVPTNTAIQNAIKNGLIIPWESQDGIVGINDMTDAKVKANAIKKLGRFVRYHFQDNSVFISGVPVDRICQTATMKLDNSTSKFGTYINKFYRIGVSGGGNSINLTTENNSTTSVVTENGLYNIMTRDYIFNVDPLTKLKEVNGTGTGSDYSTSTISTSSTAVIHQINNVLRFQ